MTIPSIATILQAFNEEISTGSIFLRTSQHADRVTIIDDGFMNRIARAEGSEITVRPIRKEPQINADERRYDYNNFINISQPEQSNTNHQFPPNSETFYYLLGRFRKPQRAQRHAEKTTLLCASLRPLR